VQPRGQQQALDSLWHGGENESATGAVRAPMRAHENAQTCRVNELDATQVDQEITDTRIDGLGQRSAHISNGGRA